MVKLLIMIDVIILVHIRRRAGKTQNGCHFQVGLQNEALCDRTNMGEHHRGFISCNGATGPTIGGNDPKRMVL